MEIANTTKNTFRLGISGEELVVDEKLAATITNKAGVTMWKIKYWVLKTDQSEYKITDPAEHRSLLQAINNPVNRFIKIQKDVISISLIKSIKEKIGYITKKSKTK